MRAARFVSLLSVLLLLACGSSSEEVTPPEPLVHLAQLPLSLRATPDAPQNPVAIEVGAAQIRLDGQDVQALSAGSLPEDAVEDGVITALARALEDAPARRRSALTVAATTPMATTAAILHTLDRANLHEHHFAVRPVGEQVESPRWMRIRRLRVVPADTTIQTVEFESSPRPWSDFVEHWRDIYQACQQGDMIQGGCDARVQVIAEGGNLGVVLFTRDNAMRVIYQRTGVTEEEDEAAAEEEAARRRGPALIEGIAAPEPEPAEGEEEPEIEPVDYAYFTWNFREAVQPESAIGAALNPVCGAERCPVLLDTDARTHTMRFVSFLAAAFPPGAAEPELVFKMP